MKIEIKSKDISLILEDIRYDFIETILDKCTTLLSSIAIVEINDGTSIEDFRDHLQRVFTGKKK